MTTTALNPLQNAKDNIGFVMDFLVLTAGGVVSEEVKTMARDVLLPLAETKSDLSIVSALEAFEQVPELQEFAARLRKAALPGEFGKYFNPDEYHKLANHSVVMGPTRKGMSVISELLTNEQIRHGGSPVVIDKGSSMGFVLPAQKHGEAHTFIVGQSAKGKSLMPDNSELTMGLATKAFQMIGRDDFSVSANLSVDNPDSLRNFGLLESILLMAFNHGLSQAKDAIVSVAGTKLVSMDAASQCLDAIDDRLQLGAMEPL